MTEHNMSAEPGQGSSDWKVAAAVDATELGIDVLMETLASQADGSTSIAEAAGTLEEGSGGIVDSVTEACGGLVEGVTSFLGDLFS